MITMDQLNCQLKVLNEDKQKTHEKMLQILGAIKVIEFLIAEFSKSEDINPLTNGGGNS